MKETLNLRYFSFATVKNVRATFLGNLYRMNFSLMTAPKATEIRFQNRSFKIFLRSFCRLQLNEISSLTFNFESDV
ncbi:hypothetical protein KHM19_10140 [Leptospira borgpetersenii]|nr:hypothetical protein C4Q31_12135 [Leptospira borgpetersenii serovar Ceylonica]GIM18571.1 hypothetical protein KHM09_10220 [Leptospira borgpetersenii]GIM21831.1 hypothetical protein KHM19_10140 [Leptospira borgpetersenii]GIM25307.1 hypothetical protein KHM25_12320 [Leptospira borgpetersenii]